MIKNIGSQCSTLTNVKVKIYRLERFKFTRYKQFNITSTFLVRLVSYSSRSMLMLHF